MKKEEKIKEVQIKQAIDTLRRWNLVRHGKMIARPTRKEVTWAIDVIIKVFSKNPKLIIHTEEVLEFIQVVAELLCEERQITEFSKRAATILKKVTE